MSKVPLSTFRSPKWQIHFALLLFSFLGGNALPACAGTQAIPEAQNVNGTGLSQTSGSGDKDPDQPTSIPKIDKKTYLQMRAKHILRLRGIDDPAKADPHLRVNAIHQLERQEVEQRLTRLKQAATLHGSLLDVGGPAWKPIGPAPFPNAQVQSGLEVPGSGRVTAIAVHPSNPDTLYAGAAQGGVYRSLDGGATWTPLMDNALSLAVGAIAIAPSQPSTIYVGTGEANFSADSFFGVGVYRIDHADTNPILVGPLNIDATFHDDIFTGTSISQIVVHPTDPNTIFVGSMRFGVSGVSGQPGSNFAGLYRSTNAAGPSGSVTFTQLIFADITDIAMEPGNPNSLLVAVFSGGFIDGQSIQEGIYRSTNALAGTPTFLPTLTRNFSIVTKFAINKTNGTTTVLAATDELDAACRSTTGNAGMVRKSIDGGATWPATIQAASGFCGGQCGYDQPVAIDPTNANRIFIGGDFDSDDGSGPRPLHSCQSTAFAKSTDGATFSIQDVSLHADAHAIAVAPSNPSIIYFGNDGGIFKSTDAGNTWMSINTSGFSAMQFQSLALHPTDGNFMIGGTQDNGTQLMRADGTWFRADFGDGGFSAIDQNATDTSNVTMYHTYFNGTNGSDQGVIGVARNTTVSCAIESQWSFLGIYGGLVNPTRHCDGTTDVFNGIQLTDLEVLFYAPIALGPGTPNTLYFGTDRLYRSPDRGNAMSVVSQAPIFPTFIFNGIPVDAAPISAIGVSPQNDNVRIVGLVNGKVFATTSGSSTLTDITGAIPFGYIARAVVDPNNSNIAYVTLDGYHFSANAHVWKTTNLNAVTPTWTASGHGIPDVPVNAFVIDPANSSLVYAGTDIGVYKSADGGANWAPFGTGLPRVAVFDLAIQSTKHVLRAATHGRGIWEITTSKPTITMVSSSQNPSTFGQSVTFTAVVSSNLGTPTGAVQFKDGSSNMGAPVTLSGGSASITTASVSGGTHTITATYSGDANFADSAGTLPTQTVNQASSTIAVVSNGNPSVFGQSVAFTANISTTGPATPTGTVQFKDGGNDLGFPVTLSGTTATLATSVLSLGVHTLTAVYSGDTNFTGSTGSLPTQTVNQANSTTAVSSDHNPSAFGQAVTFKATVSASAPGSGTPSGTVQFREGGSNLGPPVALSGGMATFTTSGLSVGEHTITVVYSGDPNFTDSTGSLSTQAVNRGDTSSGLSSSLNPSDVGQTVTFTAAIAASALGSGMPTGTVTFFDGVSSLGTSVLDGTGHATFATASLSAGAHDITVQYGGDGNFNGSTSLVLIQGVGRVDIAVTLVHHPAISAIGGKLSFVSRITNNGPLSANVAFTEQLSGKLLVVSATATTGPCTIDEGQVRCALGAINNGDSATVTITVTPLPLTRTIQAIAAATPNLIDNTPGNNTATDTAVVRFKPFTRN